MSKYSVALEKVVKDLSFQVVYSPKSISSIYIIRSSFSYSA